MHGRRLFVCVALVASTCTANDPPTGAVPVVEVVEPPAVPPPAADKFDRVALDARLGLCHGDGDGHPFGAIMSAERLGDAQVLIMRTPDGALRRVLLFEQAGGTCPAFAVVPEAAYVRGDYLGDGTQRTVALLSQADDGVSCDKDACPVAVLVRDEMGVVLAAVDPGLGCETYTLATVRLFADRDSIELRCNGGTVDTERRVQLLHVFGDALRPLLAFTAGVTRVTLTEDDKRMCTSRSKDGSYEIKAKGAAPVVEVFEVSDLRQATRATWTFDAAQQRMVQGKQISVKLAAPRATCTTTD